MVLGPICLYLSKPFCWRTVFYNRSVFCNKSVFCSRSVFCCRFALCCRLLSLHFFLWTFLALRSSLWVFGPWFLLGFWIWIHKNGHQHLLSSKEKLSHRQNLISSKKWVARQWNVGFMALIYFGFILFTLMNVSHTYL